jgi:raffinose/stachyose/melibiose transport system substrate-binding protein
MKKGTYKALRRLFLLLLCAVLLTGCADGDIPSGETDTNQGSARGKQSGQMETQEHEALTICTAGMNYTYFLNALHEKYPEINLKLVSYDGADASGYMKDTLVNGDIPDIYTSNYRQSDKLQETYLLNLGNYDFINNYSDTMLDDVDVDGDVYMLPSRYQVAGINYNKTMFEEHGWKVPETFEELQALVEQIRAEEPDVTPVAAKMSQKNYVFQYLFALGSTDFLGTTAGTQWKQAFLDGSATAVGNLESTADYLKEWIDAGYIADYNSDGTDLMSDFYDGKIAMVLGTGTSAWSGTGKTTGENIEVGIMAWPGENGNHGMLLSSVERYYGLSKKLAEPGNEQKLEDALKVLDFISTEEGQAALCSGSWDGMVFPFSNFEIGEDSPLYEVKDDIEQGYTAPLTYEKWEEKLLSPMADEILALVHGDISTEEMLAQFDEINQNVHENPQSYTYATLDENLTKEQTARLAAMAMMKYTDAEVSLVSLGGITEDGNYLENPTGVQCGIYAEDITEEIIDIFRPNSTQLSVIGLTGKEIKKMASDGRELYADPDESGSEYAGLSAPVTYYMPYVLVTQNDEALSDDKTYRVVFAAGDYSDRIAGEWGDRLETLTDKSPADAIASWLKKQPDGHFGVEALEFY